MHTHAHHTHAHTYIQTPIFSYSALYPHKVFLTSYKDDYEMSYIYDLQVILSATIVVKPRILDSILNAVGTDQFIYLYAKVSPEEGGGGERESKTWPQEDYALCSITVILWR